MKISTKGRYALEAILDLAMHTSNGHECLKNVAMRRKISENYLEQIFIVLRRKGIVESIRGSQGGYKLAKDAKDISAGEVIRALEGPLTPVNCTVLSDKETSCGKEETCATRNMWCRIASEVDAIVDALSIEDLKEWIRNHSGEDTIDYYI